METRKNKSSIFDIEADVNRFKVQPNKESDAKVKPQESPQKTASTDTQPLSKAKEHQMQVAHYDHGMPIQLSLTVGEYHYEPSQAFAYDNYPTPSVYEQQSYDYPPQNPQDFVGLKPNDEASNTYLETLAFEDNDTIIPTYAAPKDPTTIVAETIKKSNGLTPSLPIETMPIVESKVTTASSLSKEPDEAQFYKDLTSILQGKGEKQYDPNSKMVVDNVPQNETTDGTLLPPSLPPSVPEPKTEALSESNEHGIFDKIARNMNLANAFDLGSFSMQNRFDAFDKQMDLDDKMQTFKNKAVEPITPEIVKPQPTGHDFIHDIDKMNQQWQVEPAIIDNYSSAKSVKINYSDDVNQSSIPPYTLILISNIAEKAGESDIKITSALRTVEEQATVMYDNCEKKGVDSQKRLYGPNVKKKEN
jgi:hypothetical protein